MFLFRFHGFELQISFSNMALAQGGHDWLFPPLQIFKALSGTDYVLKKIPSSSMSSIAS